MKKQIVAASLSFALAASPLLAADASYTRTHTMKSPFNTSGPMGGMMKQMGGGDMMKAFEPSTDTIMVHGNKMVTVTNRGVTIMDLDKQVWIETDKAKHEYSVMTFQQMSDMVERFGKMGEQANAMGRGGPAANAPQPEMETSVDIKEENPGTTKDVGGYTATEHIFTAKITIKYKDAAKQAQIDQTPGAAAVTSVLYTEEVWTLQAVPPAYQAIRDFEQRMGEKMAGAMSPAASVVLPRGVPSTPGAANGMLELQRRAAALPGLHVITVTRMSMPIDMAALAAADGQPAPAAPAAPAANSGSQTQATGSSAGQGAAQGAATGAANSGAQSAISKLGGIGGAMARGGFAGFGSKKAATPAPAAPAPAAPAPAAPAAQAAPATGGGSPFFSETTVELGNFSMQPVSLADFEVPSGYKQVPSPMEKFLDKSGK